MTDTADSILSKMEPRRGIARTLGAIFIENGRLSHAQVDEILKYAAANNLRFGDAAVQLEALSQFDIDWAIGKQFNHPVLSRSGQYSVGGEVVAAYDPQRQSLEALRSLRSQLILAWRSNSARKVLTIASAARGDGRSWLAANLATMFAQVGEKTLLIDADLRHPRQHSLFRVPSTSGLSAILTGRAGREVVTRIHPNLRLSVLAAGAVPPNPQELLERPVFEVVFDLFASQFDVVIVDTPAMAENSDAQIIAARTGAAILLARRHHTRRGELMSAAENLRRTGANIFGSVITDH
jgi:receptor protein-tyrosine kinase